MTGHQKEWKAKENREGDKALLLLLNSGPISEAWAEALNKSDRDNLIQHRRLATLRMLAEGSLSRWEGKCSSPEEWIEKAVEETRGILAKHHLTVPGEEIRDAVKVSAGF